MCRVAGNTDLKIEHFGAVFTLDLTEETRTQLQEEDAIASSCLILAMPIDESTLLPRNCVGRLQYLSVPRTRRE